MKPTRILIAALLLACSAAHADPLCYPAKAGGNGTDFATKKSPAGTVYVWRCVTAEPEVLMLQAIRAPAWMNPKSPNEAHALKVELSRLWVMEGEAREIPESLTADAMQMAASAAAKGRPQ